MALALPRLNCQTCGNFIDPGDPYVVTPDIAGVGADRVACLACGPREDLRVCGECGESIEDHEIPVHGYCADAYAGGDD